MHSGGTLYMCLTLITFKVIQSESCFKYETVVSEDMHMKGRAFRQLGSSSVYDSAAKCVMSSACKSFNFDKGSRTCQLNSNSSSEVDPDPKSGFLFSDIHHGPASVAGPCSGKPCPNDKDCNVDRFGKAHCIEVQTVLGSPCSTVQDCGGGAHTECTDARCRCQLGYLHSASQLYCMRECDNPSDVFEGYVDKGVKGYNNDSIKNVDEEGCRTACSQAVWDCRHVEYRRSNGLCYLSRMAWFDLPEANRVLNDPGYTLNIRQCT